MLSYSNISARGCESALRPELSEEPVCGGEDHIWYPRTLDTVPCKPFRSKMSSSTIYPDAQNGYTAAFHRLPPEILDLIADNVWITLGGDRFPNPILYARLRLVCPAFAGMASINKRVFGMLFLNVTPEQVIRLPHAPVKLLGRYVESVVFKPSPFPWLMGPNLFPEILTTDAVYQSWEDHGFTSGISSVRRGMSCSSFLGSSGYVYEHPFESDPPFTDAEVQAAYSAYRWQAMQARHLICQAILRDA